jgi:alpha-N-arabinofuranosidase
MGADYVLPVSVYVRYGRGTALKAQLDTPSYACSAGDDIPYVDCAAVLNERELTLFIVNKHLERDIECRIRFSDMSAAGVRESIILSGYALETKNNAESEMVRPVHLKCLSVNSNGISFTLSKASWNMLLFELN